MTPSIPVIDVTPLEGTLVVNFGQVLEQWSAGRIRASEPGGGPPERRGRRGHDEPALAV